MEKDYEILNQITPENANPYSTPVGYFESLAGEVLFKIKTKQASYIVPPNYFNNLSIAILAKVKDYTSETFEELELIAPLLNTISKQNVYDIPTAYFDGFEVVKPSSTKIVSIQKHTKKWTKYVVAASIIGVISIGALFFYKKPDNVLPDFQASLQNINDTELKKEMETDKTTYTVNEDATATLPWQSLANLQDEMQFVTDEEMDLYIKENNLIDEG